MKDKAKITKVGIVDQEGVCSGWWFNGKSMDVMAWEVSEDFETWTLAGYTLEELKEISEKETNVVTE